MGSVHKIKENGIHWRPEEIAVVVKKARDLGPIPPGGLTARIKQAQFVLPPLRRRPLGGDLYKFFTERLNDIMVDLQHNTVPTEQPPQQAPEATTGRKLIRWRDDELITFFNAAREATKRGLDGQARAVAAMEALPPNRRRNTNDISLHAWITGEVARPEGSIPMPNYKAFLDQRKIGFRDKAVARKAEPATTPPPTPQPAPPPAPEPIQAPTRPANGVQATLPLDRPPETRQAIPSGFADDTEAPRDVSELLAEAAGQFLGELIASALRYEPVRDALRGLVNTALGQTVSAPPVPAHSFNAVPNPLRKPKVLIAGLKGHQMTVINDAMKDKFVLRFWHVDQSMNALRLTASECDVAIGFANFLSHSADAIMKDRAKSYIRFHGGLEGLKQKLGQLAEKYPASARQH